VQIGELARDVGASAVLDGGDFFDIKSPTRNSHSLVRRVIELHRDYPCPVYANVGNHDCVYGDYSYLHQQPLGVLFGSGTFKRCYDQYEGLFTYDLSAEDVTETGPRLTVRVVGVPYHGTGYDLDRFAKIKKGSEDYLVIIAHVLASPTGGALFESEDVIKYADLDNYDGDAFCFGHWHKDQGITRTEAGKVIVNVGSMTRGSLAQDDLERIPSAVHLRFTPSGITAEKIALRHAPVSEVFDLEARDIKNLRENMIEEFVDSLKSILATGKERSIRDAIRDLPNVPEAVKEQAILYVEKAGG